MNADLIAFIIFIILVSIFLIVKRKNLKLHKFLHIFYFCMYRTKAGLRLMNAVARRFERILRRLCIFIIVICFAGMFFVSFELMIGLYNLLAHKQSLAVALVLPFEVEGAFYVPFIYWLLCILIIATVHEFSHGVFARLYKIKIKSAGFAFLGIIFPLIPAAFVEPNEKQLQKKTSKEQLAVFSAGPFANVMLGLIALAVFSFVFAPATDNFYKYNGVEITEVVKGSPAAGNLLVGQVIKEVDDKKIATAKDFSNAFAGTIPGDEVIIKTGAEEEKITLIKNPSDENDAYLGIFVKELKEIRQIGFLDTILVYLKDFFYWLFILNLGVGLFNLVPLGPLDGGRMFRTVVLKVIYKKNADYLLKAVNFIFIFLIVGSIVMGLLV